MTRAHADDRDPQVVEVAEERGGADERIEVLGMADVAAVHDDELLVETKPFCPVVPADGGREPLRVDPVRDHAHPPGWSSLLLEPKAHRVSDRDYAVRATEIERNEPSKHAHHGTILEPLELYGDLREDVLTDHDERHAVAARDEERDVTDDRRIGHAQDNIWFRSAQATE